MIGTIVSCFNPDRPWHRVDGIVVVLPGLPCTPEEDWVGLIVPCILNHSPVTWHRDRFGEMFGADRTVFMRPTENETLPEPGQSPDQFQYAVRYINLRAPTQHYLQNGQSATTAAYG